MIYLKEAWRFHVSFDFPVKIVKACKKIKKLLVEDLKDIDYAKDQLDPTKVSYIYIYKASESSSGTSSIDCSTSLQTTFNLHAN